MNKQSMDKGVSLGLWLKDTESILSPRWRHLSVCFGEVVIESYISPLKYKDDRPNGRAFHV